MVFIYELNNKDWIIDIIKIIIISNITFYTSLYIINNKIEKNTFVFYIMISICAILCVIVKYFVNYLSCMILLILFLALVLSYYSNYNLLYCSIVEIISLTTNYIFYLIAVALVFIPCIVLKINDKFLILISIIGIYIIFIFNFFKIKKFRNGFSFLKRVRTNEYFDIMIITISIIILFLILTLNYNSSIENVKIIIELLIFSLLLLVVIQKSIQLYYKQKLLIQDLNETKNELEEKKKEIKILEEENLNFSKKSHSLAHKQKVLEHKINKLLLKNKYSEELDLKNKVEEISEELYKDTEYSYVNKTGITNIDDMLETMQEECKKSNIEFNVQICGNIFEMINNYVEKEDLEILLADHIKDAIIAVNHSNNVNRTILVKLGKVADCFGLYFYDSGVEFNKDVLKNLGKRPITTYIDEGGTGMGFMNTFDTLKKYNASLIIKNIGAPSKENFTKVIMIKFDKNAKFCLTN